MKDKVKATIMAIIGFLVVYVLFVVAIVGIIIAPMAGTKVYKKYAKTILSWLLKIVS